jgi:hypothetical protein
MSESKHCKGHVANERKRNWDLSLPKKRGMRVNMVQRRAEIRRKGPNGHEKRVKSPPYPPPPASDVKARFLQLQLANMARSMKPADFPFDPKTKEELRKVQVELMHKQLQREISQNDFALQTTAVNNLVRILESTEIDDRLNELEQQAQTARKLIADMV